MQFVQVPFFSRSSSWSLNEIPRTGPFWILQLETNTWRIYWEMLAGSVPSHQMGCESGDFVSKTFWWDDSYFIADFLVCVKVERKARVELQLVSYVPWMMEVLGRYFFNHDPGGLFNCTCTNSTLALLVVLGWWRSIPCWQDVSWPITLGVVVAGDGELSWCGTRKAVTVVSK